MTLPSLEHEPAQSVEGTRLTDALYTLGLGAMLLGFWYRYHLRFGHARWRDREEGVFQFMPTVKRIFDFTFLPIGLIAIVVGTVQFAAAVL